MSYQRLVQIYNNNSRRLSELMTAVSYEGVIDIEDVRYAFVRVEHNNLTQSVIFTEGDLNYAINMAKKLGKPHTLEIARQLEAIRNRLASGASAEAAPGDLSLT